MPETTHQLSPGARYRRRLLKSLRQNPLAGCGAFFVLLLVIVGLAAPLLATHDPFDQDLWQRDKPPSQQHWFGTDGLGRDICSRVVYGARVSLTIGVIAQGVALSIGVTLGLLAGYYRGWADRAIMWLVNVAWAFPSLLLVLAIQFALGNRPENVFLAIGLTSWVPIARVVRGETLSLRERDFVASAHCLGVPAHRILARHLLPNLLPTVIVMATLGLATAIIAEAALSFLGLGIQPPNPSWGNMILDGYTRLRQAWWQAVFPSLAILLSVLSFNLLGDALAGPRTDL